MPGTIPPGTDALKGAFTSPFAFGVYRELRATSGSLCVSPFGVASVLAMAQAGAVGTTRGAIEDTLHCPAAGEGLIARVGAVTRELQALAHQDDRALHLSLANALWIQKGYAIHRPYVESLKSRLGAEVLEADFAAEPSAAVREINAWVTLETGGRIRWILSEGQLSPLTRCVLSNAVYLKAPWSLSFHERHTRNRPFHMADGTTIEVSTMFREAGFAYLRDGDVQVVGLAYRSPRVSMLVVLPGPGQLERVERELDAARLTALLEAMEDRDIKLFLPRFRVESSFLLRRLLEQLGMKVAFGPDADFTGASSEPGFRVDQVAHETFVSVDESGTEAAGATFGTHIGGVPRGEFEVRVDRPFLFLIRDADTGTILFMGRVMDPRG